MRIGIDLGGTKIEGILIDGEGREVARRRLPTPRGDYGETIAQIARLVESLRGHAGADRPSVGVGIPGALSPATGLVKNANATWLIGRPLDRDLAAAFGQPVRIDNDANCFAVSEAVDGAAAGARVVFGVILGTGVGGGLAIDGRALRGRNAIAGEWGHNALPWTQPDEAVGRLCYCGLRGCIETYLSGPGLSAAFAERTGRVIAAEEIVAAAEGGDASAQAALERYVCRLARALATVINIVDPDVIVLGGGLSNIDRLYGDVPQRWRRWVFSDATATELKRNRHGDSSGVRGAAWLWPAAQPGRRDA